MDDHERSARCEVQATRDLVGRPYTTNGGKNAHVRVQRVSQPGVTETKMWGAYEKVTVMRRATAEEGKR